MRVPGGGLRAIVYAALLLAAGLARAHAQGGPPMITDDPGTPGDRHWEFNLVSTSVRTPGVTELGLPLLDMSYGIGDRLQLNYQGSWNVLRTDGQPVVSGMSDSQLAVKWRFYDAGEQGWQASTFPRITFLTPGTHSDRRGLASAHPEFLLPFEVRKDLGPFSIDADFGHIFSRTRDEEGWIGGVCIGRQISKGVELDGEVHVIATESADRSEWIGNLGARVDLSPQATLMLAIGRDLRNTMGPRASVLTYAGIQLRR